MALKGNAILAVWNDVDPDIEDDFNEWYFGEHIPERASVPGINHGRRYRADAGATRYMAFYEATSMDVLTKGAHRVQLNDPTNWTRRIMPHFRFAQRGQSDVAGTVGEGIGGAAAVVHLTPGDEPRLRKWIVETLLHELHALPDVANVHFWTLSPGEPRSPTSELSLPAEPARAIEWVIVAETMEFAGAEAIQSAILGRNPKAHGAADVRP
ncbi:MAG: hypothetical protein EXR07_13030 [Acetobacteraceae bacterium]|nr:hypothetical protein [Acetobacteraceae bacterium]